MELQPRQREALTPLRDRWIHADPPGTGKTPMGLTWLDEQDAKRVLIVAPARVLSHWHDLIPEWTTLKSVNGMGTPAQRGHARSAIAHSGALVIGYETMRQDANTLMTYPWDAVIFDEAHRLKGRKNLVHKAATKLARRIPLIDLASGSPILNDAEEAWSLLHLLDPKRYSSFWRWAHEYFEVTSTTFHGKSEHAIGVVGEPKDGALEAIAADLGTSLVMRDEDYLLPDLPKLIEYDYHVDMLPEEKAAYESMLKHNWMRTTGGKNIIASNVVAQMTRLRQLTSDFGELLDTDLPGSKVETAVEVVREIGEPVLVLTAFKHTARKLQETLGHAAALFTGDQNEANLEGSKQAFERGQTNVLIGTFGVIREGVDGLQKAAHHVVLLDHEWTPELNRQAIARLRRYGQQSPEVYVHHIVLRDSIDQTVALANERKQKVIDVIVGKPVSDVLHGNL